MNNDALQSQDIRQLFAHTLKGNFIIIGIAISAIGLSYKGIWAIMGGIIGIIMIALALSQRLDPIIRFASKRKGTTFLRLIAMLMPILMAAATLVVPILVWLGWNSGIPIESSTMIAAGLFLLSALLSIWLLIRNIAWHLRNS